MNNSVYRKTIENILNRIDVKLITYKKAGLKLSSKPNYQKTEIFEHQLFI